MNIMDKVRRTPRCDWPVADQEQSGVGNFVGLYGGEHIAATEFVIGATLVQYGCSATDILIGLAIGNLLAVLTFTFLCARIAVDTRLTLYSFLARILGEKMQKVYDLIWGVGFSALGAAGLCISATAIRRIFRVPIQHMWYPTSFKFVLIVAVLGIVITLIAANGFEAVAKFASTCVPWMISLFFLGIVVVLPQLMKATGYGSITSAADLLRLLNTHVWTAEQAGGSSLGIIHVIAFAWTCNVAWHFALNDMSLLRYAKDYKYGFTSAVGMYIGHFFAWISAGIMGATASILLSTPLAQLDSGEVTFAVLGYAGLLAVIIAGWTTANPTFYRVALSLNAVFKKLSHKQTTYIAGCLITLAACFPVVQRAADILTFLGLAVEGVGAICITEQYIFPKIGYTRYWNMYKNKKGVNWAATISWGISIAFVAVMILTRPVHQNFWFIPNYIIPMVSYIILAGLMGAKEAYPEEEREELAYEAALQEYANSHVEMPAEVKTPAAAAILRGIGFADLAVMVIGGIVCMTGGIDLTLFKGLAAVNSVVYFACNGAAMAVIAKAGKKAPAAEAGADEKAAAAKQLAAS